SLFCKALKKILFHWLSNTVMYTTPRLRVMRVASSPRAAQRSSENQYGLGGAQTFRKKDLVVIGRRVLSFMLVVLGQVIGHPVLLTPRARPGKQMLAPAKVPRSRTRPLLIRYVAT